jgi:hypothetical protein
VGKNYVNLAFPERWLEDNPLTAADLRRERGYLRKVGFKVHFE